MTSEEFWQMLAAMDDVEFSTFLRNLGVTPAPSESASDFRARVVETVLHPAGTSTPEGCATLQRT